MPNSTDRPTTTATVSIEMPDGALLELDLDIYATFTHEPDEGGPGWIVTEVTLHED